MAGPVSIAGDKEEIQMLVEFAPEAEFEPLKQSRIADSTQPADKNNLYLIGLEPGGFQQQVEEIYRSEQIYHRYRNKTVEKEVSEYLNGQQQRAENLRGELTRKLRQGLAQGSFIFRGRPQAVASLGGNTDEATKKQLGEAANEVFHKYHEAPVQAESALAERFLKTERLDRIESKHDPLNLVGNNGRIVTSQAALKSVVDYLNQAGREEGRVLLDKFSRAPYGWSKDTLRYIVAALLVGGEIKLRVSGEDITVRGPTAIDSLKSNAAFNRVGVALRDGGIDPENLLRAAERLLTLTGQDVLPLEDEVSKNVTRYFPDLQREYAHLSSELRNLRLPGMERADRIQDSLSEILKGDASDAALRLGPEQCSLYDDLLWARQVAKALAGDFPETVRNVNQVLSDIPQLPDVGLLAELKTNTQSQFAKLTDTLGKADFFNHIADIQTHLANVQQVIKNTANALAEEYAADLEAAKHRLEERPEWQVIGGPDQERFATALDELQISVKPTLTGIHRCLNARYPLQQKVAAIEKELTELAAERGTPMELDEPEESTWMEEFSLPREVTSADELDVLIQRLQKLKTKFKDYARIVFSKGNS